jgi:hypothetical protein
VSVPATTESAFFNAAHATAFLLVEGPDDERFWLPRVNPRTCQVRPMKGRKAALDQLALARREARPGLVAVLDADFDRLEGVLAEYPDVVWTDLHDLEGIFIASPALEKVLAETASRAKLRSADGEDGAWVRDALLARAVPIGRLRWHSAKQRLDLIFRKREPEGGFKYIDYGAFCRRTTWEMDARALVQEVLDFSQRPQLDVDTLIAGMAALPEVDRWQLCVGHDMVGLLAVGLRTKLGNRNLRIEELQERLRLAFETGHLEATSMYRALREWEARNAPFRVFGGSDLATRVGPGGSV